MSLSRRGFVQTVGSVGLSGAFISGRGREAMAFDAAAIQAPDDNGFIRINSNENARGPGRSAIEAIKGAVSPRVGRDESRPLALTWRQVGTAPPCPE